MQRTSEQQIFVITNYSRTIGALKMFSNLLNKDRRIKFNFKERSLMSQENRTYTGKH